LSLLIAIAAFVAAFAIGTILHELAHAIAAVFVGFRLRRVRIGIGTSLFRGRLGDAEFEVGAIPGWGMVEIYPPLRDRRLAMFLHVAAGPAMDVLLLVAFVDAHAYLPAGEIGNAIIMPAILAQLTSTLANLWPHRAVVYGRETANDGLLMCQILWGTASLKSYRDGYCAILSRSLQPGEALPVFNAQSEKIAWHLMTRLAPPREATGTADAALEGLLTNDMPRCEALTVLDTLVTSALESIDPARLADLDQWSSRLHALAPDVATFRGSRGAVLIELGRFEEGLAMLAEAENGSPFNDCLVCAFRALGHFRQAEDARAKIQFSRAAALFKHEEWRGLEIYRIVRRIATEIGGDFTAPSTWSLSAATGLIRTGT